MRIRLAASRWVFVGAVLLFALIALLPLRLALGWLALDRYGLTAREARGSVWLGSLREVRFGDAPLGDVSARLQLLPLLAGRARIDLAREGDAAEPLEGALSLTRHTMGFDDVTARLPLGGRFAPLPVTSLDVRDLSVRFRDGACDKADGLVKAVVERDVAGIALPGGLTGAARCDGGALLLPLASQSGMETLALRISADGGYRAELSVRPATPEARAALLAAGFAPRGAGYALTVTGKP